MVSIIPVHWVLFLEIINRKWLVVRRGENGRWWNVGRPRNSLRDWGSPLDLLGVVVDVSILASVADVVSATTSIPGFEAPEL